MKHQDYIYLKEDYYKNKKEAFSFLISILKKSNKHDFSLLDLGCSRGELLYHIKNDLPNYSKLCGLDYSKDLIENAKGQSFLKGVDFKIGNAQNFELNQEFDFIICSGLVGYFDSLDEIFKMFSKHLKKGGTALVFSIFNEFDVDVHVKYRNNKYFDQFESGWNIHSINTAKATLKIFGLLLKDTHKFQLSFDDKPKKDPARSWTQYIDGNKKFINGLGQIYDLTCLEINK